MFTAEKTNKNVSVARTKTTGTTFFRKAGEDTFFNNNENNRFFGATIQPKLTISKQDDPLEKEADAVAETVMRMPDTVAVTEKEDDKLQLKEEEDDIEIQPKLNAPRITTIQRKEENVQSNVFSSIQHSSAGDYDSSILDSSYDGSYSIQPKHISLHHSDVLQCSGRGPPQSFIPIEHTLQSSKGAGSPLPDTTRSYMESRFNADFNGVRIHTDSTAQSVSDNMHAQAFTHGNDIYFNTGKYAPHTTDGNVLLAHELTHTVQQGASKSNSVQRKSADFRTLKGFPYHVLNQAHSARRTSLNPVTAPPTVKTPVRSQTPSRSKSAINSAASPPQREKLTSTQKGKAEPPSKQEDIGGNTPPPVRAPATPKQDPDFQKAKKSIVRESVKQKSHHQPAETKRVEAENAAALPPNEQISQDAKEKSTAAIEAVAEEQTSPEKRFSAASFKESFKALINEKKPKTEDAAKEMAKKPPVENISESFSAGVAKEQSAITGPLEEKAVPNPSGGEQQKDIVGIPNPARPPKPAPVNSKAVIPKARTDEEISAQKEIDRIDGTMTKNKLSDDQLTESREPSFIETYTIKETAKQKAAEVPKEYRQKEEGILQNAEAKAEVNAAARLNGFMTKNKNSGTEVLSKQSETETQTEKRQREIKEAIEGIYNFTVIQVKFILQTMTDKVKNDFTKSLKEKTDIFNANLRSRISSYYGSFRIDDELFGPDPVVVNDDGTTRSLTGQEKYDMMFNGKEIDVINPDVYRIFVSEKNIFTEAMDVELDAIALNVERGLINAHNTIKAGELMIATFKSTLKGNELTFANQLEAEVKLKFENLEKSIDDAKDDLLNTLADEYKDNLKAMEKSFKEINDELKKSWIDRAIEFIETVAKTIYQLVDLVVSILVRLANIVWDIIKHPIRFFETLVKGLFEGIAEFIENIGTYLQDAFWTWVTGAVPGGTVKLTMGSGVEGMFKLVLNVLQLGTEDLKKVAGKVLGKEFMETVDKITETIDKGIEIGAKILEPVIILITQGPAALWQYVKEHVQEFIQTAFDRIKESVFFAFIEKGIKYIAGFFIPGGGFVKIVKAIVSAFQFIADNLENIRNFFDAIFDSMEEAIAGNTTGVKNKVLLGLKTGVVMALDFLAKLLGLDKIVESIQKIIQTIRTAILNAVEFILLKIKPYVQPIIKKVKELYQKGKEAVVGAGKKVLGWLGLRKQFKDDKGGEHEIYFKGTENAAALYVASYTPKTVKTLLAAVSKFFTKPGNVHQQNYNTAVTLHSEIEALKSTLLNKANTNADKDNADMNQKLAQLALQLPPLMTLTGATEPPPLLKPAFANGVKAGSFEVFYLKKGRTQGGSTANTNSGATLAGWSKINQSGLSAKSAWVKMHLLTEQLGGPALDLNLTPARGPETNSVFYREVEKHAIDAVSDGKVIWFQATIDYHGGANNDYPAHIKMEWGPYQFNNSNDQWEKKPKGSIVDGDKVGGSHSQNPPPPDFSGSAVLPNLNDPLVGRVKIENIAKGLNRPFVEFIQQVRAEATFKNENTMEKRLKDAYKQRTIPIENFDAQVAALKSQINKTYTLQKV